MSDQHVISQKNIEIQELRLLVAAQRDALILAEPICSTPIEDSPAGIAYEAVFQVLRLTPADLADKVLVKQEELGLPVPRPAEVGFVDYFRQIMYAHGYAMKDKGFWDNRNIPGAEVWVKLGLNALVCSELGEATTGIRKDCPDDHLTNRSMEVCEMADVILRVMDYCAFYNLPVAEVLVEKMEYNKSRAHKHGDKKA